MKKFLYISSLLVFAIALASCSKDEVESPAETPHAKALKVERTQTPIEDLDGTAGYIQAGPQYINDDGDDEDEGIKGAKGTKVKN